MAKRTQRSKGYRKGSQLDAMRRIRKAQPPATKVEKRKDRPQRDSNWRDLLEDNIDDFDDYEEWE
jgi:hypothetical protein